MVGRPRTVRNKRRLPISISLPPQMIEELDNFLSEKQSRSRFIESLLKRTLIQKHGAINPFIEHKWSCTSCQSVWKTNRPKVRTFHCIEKTCLSELIQYEGIYTGEEE